MSSRFSFSFPSSTPTSFSFSSPSASSSTRASNQFDFGTNRNNNANVEAPSFVFNNSNPPTVTSSNSTFTFSPPSVPTTNSQEHTTRVERPRKQVEDNSSLEQKLKELQAENDNLCKQIELCIADRDKMTTERNSLASQLETLKQNQGVTVLTNLKLESQKQYELLIVELHQLQNTLLTERDPTTKQQLISQRNQKRRDIISCIEQMEKDAHDQLLPYAKQLVLEWLDIKLHHYSPVKTQLEADIAMEEELKEVGNSSITTFQEELEEKQIEIKLYEKRLKRNANDKELEASINRLNSEVDQLKEKIKKQTDLAALGGKRTNPLFGFPELQSGVMDSIEQEEIQDLRKEYDDITESLKFCVGTRKSDGVKVFIKKYDKLSDWKHFKNEVETLKRLNHQCVITINRAMYDDRFYYIEMPFIAHGTLYDWLFKKVNTIHPFDSKNERTAFEVQRMMRLVIETVDYLHENDVIHRDLKMENIMMQNDTLPIIIDFDMSKDNQNSQRINLSTMKGGTLRYMDPQVQWGNASLNTKSDVYSFGVVLLKVFAKLPMKMEAIPMPNKNTPDLQATSLIIEDEDLIRLLKKCLHTEQDKRPTAHDILYSKFFMKHLSNSKEEEQTEMSQSRVKAFKKFVTDKRSTAASRLLDITINENTMLDDLPSNLITACNNNTIYNRLIISFVGQQGVDAGALTTSFFRKFVQQLVDKKILEKGTSCFHICEDAALPQFTLEKRRDLMICFGIVLAKCLYDQRSIGQVQLSNILIKFLLSKDTRTVQTSLVDFEQFDLRMSNDLNNLHFTNVSDLCLDFSNLKIGGDQIEVTNENLNDYISLKMNSQMIESRRQNMEWIRQGFYKLEELKEHFQMLHLNDYHILLTGEQRIDIATIVNHCIAFVPERSINTHQFQQAKQWMLETLLQFSQEEFKQFLLFCTGYCSTQSKEKIFENGNIHSGYARDKINIRLFKQWPNSRLPEAQVCYYLLNIPLYQNKQQLESKLKMAIANTGDFFGKA